MINYGAAWDRYYELADRRNEAGLVFQDIVSVVNASRPKPATAEASRGLIEKMEDLPDSQRLDALHYLWGTMSIRDPQACIDALTMAEK